MTTAVNLSKNHLLPPLFSIDQLLMINNLISPSSATKALNRLNKKTEN
jgi:hypothetical protein